MQKLTLREIQLESLKVLKVIRDICDKENIKYYLAWGTLLGAVRHDGFIPWDDDVDIMMPRADYERFVNFCIDHAQELKPYEIFHYRNSIEYVYALARFSNSSFCVDYNGVHNYGLGTFVDIYPLDGLGNTYDKACRNMKKNARLMKMIKLLNDDHFVASPNSKIRTILKYPAYIYAKLRGRHNLIKKLDLACKSISYEDSSYVGIPTVEITDNCIIDKTWIEKTIIHSFEDDSFPIPYKFDELLSHRYGEYMKLPPQNQQIAHHFYTVFRKN